MQSSHEIEEVSKSALAWALLQLGQARKAVQPCLTRDLHVSDGVKERPLVL